MQPDKHTKIGITKNENEILRRIDVFSQKPESFKQAGICKNKTVSHKSYVLLNGKVQPFHAGG
jgi:hypothetical protein